MNERIQELSGQAWQYADNNSRDGDGTHGWLYRDKFAELIVRECASIDFRHKVGLSSDDDFEISKVIKQHFGVE